MVGLITTYKRGASFLALLVMSTLLAGCASSTAIKGTKDEGLRLARLLRDQGRIEAATEVYARIDSRGELKGTELLEYASVAAPVRRPQQTLELYGRARHALGGDTNQLKPQEALAICLGMGRAHLALGRNAMAQKDFSCALQAQPDNAGALNGMGVVMDAAGKHTEARQLFEKALQVNPADLAAINNLALSWLASGDADQAIGLLRSADNANPAGKLNLALAYLDSDREEDARSTLATIAQPDRIDGLIDALNQRLQQLRQDGSRGETLLLSSRQRLQLSSPE
ncbi:MULTISPECIES: tetratricopeptide repeat protein [unclassified Brenneria]|uniref:tetratricopeptide repeat protein n=1 Tax=unclassified Brenneria TaxID=2634434 RepID=UPI001553BAD0|nr:tetratricopeptide repeat protein [Brenneria sp. hezel4-2-4]MEE3651119.1 tetratricopeptide repeat protein [Brenneria sp. HEZEL_4_2_4]NPD01074.1 tetratricopeptide repeat protein [Brenneria sp. hezel4-2-4]